MQRIPVVTVRGWSAGGAAVGRDAVRDGVLPLGRARVRAVRGRGAGAHRRVRGLRRRPLQDVLPRHMVRSPPCSFI